MHHPERRRDGLYRRLDRRVGRGGRLELCERGADVVERDVGVRHELRPVRTLDLVERSHGLGDRGSELNEVRRNVGVGLKGVQPAGE
jgi:hypothetical protein